MSNLLNSKNSSVCNSDSLFTKNENRFTAEEEEIAKEEKDEVNIYKSDSLSGRYADRGVSSKKDEIHEAIRELDLGIYPTAFCKVVEDHLTNDKDSCLIMHADGAGTKSSLAYIYWKEFGDVSVFKGIAQDAIVMNTDDVLCLGLANESILLSSIIGRNAMVVGKDVLRTIMKANEDICREFKSLGMNLVTAGGETADIGDIVRTITVDSTIVCRMKKSEIITNSEMSSGDFIIGLSSTGKTSYELEYNSGIGSNGLTMARHELLSKEYLSRYPETCDTQNIQNSLLYTGKYLLSDPLEDTPLTIGKAVLSPSRTYFPVIKMLLEKCRHLIKGMVHCSGGGQTKCIRFGKGLRYVKDNLFPCPPIFKVIQRESNAKWNEMYQVFNMGHRFELYGSEELFCEVQSICNLFNLECRKIGRVEKTQHEGGQNEVIIKSEYGTFLYT